MSDDYIIPFAKMSGMTSFASLSVMKRLLSTKKVGHTGTLDSFADGLLVLVTGRMTHLASFIEAKSKEYEAILCFGKETDTLDTEGAIVCEKPLPFYSDIIRALQMFLGNIMQLPPTYSALHIGGKRASDIARSGQKVILAPRNVCINKINIEGVCFKDEDVFLKPQDECDFYNKRVKYLHIRVECSKGTYVRSLARDIGLASNSCAYLVALRRLSVGPFDLKNAFGFELLPSFGLDKTLKQSCINYEKNIDEYKMSFTKKLCRDLNFAHLEIKPDFRKSFLCGKNIRMNWFCDIDEKEDGVLKNDVIFVFSFDSLLGVIEHGNECYKYRCVLRGNE